MESAGRTILLCVDSTFRTVSVELVAPPEDGANVGRLEVLCDYAPELVETHSLAQRGEVMQVDTNFWNLELQSRCKCAQVEGNCRG